MTATTRTTNRAVDKGWKPDDQPFDVEAEMCVGFGGLDEKFISRVTGRPFESVTVSLFILSKLHYFSRTIGLY